MMDSDWLSNVDCVLAALKHLKLGLSALDAAGAPAQIGAHVDLALNQLEDAIPDHLMSGLTQIDTNADPQ